MDQGRAGPVEPADMPAHVSSFCARFWFFGCYVFRKVLICMYFVADLGLGASNCALFWFF